MGSIGGYGMSEERLRAALERELEKAAGTTSFYWENDELDEVLDMVVETVAKVIAQNNAVLSGDLRRNILRDADLPPTG